MAGAAAQSGATFAGLRYVSLFAAFAPAPAFAGAWIAPEDGQTIVTQSFGQRETGQYYESSLYFEQPAAHQRIAWTASTWVERAEDASDEGWRADASVSLKAALARTEIAAASVQAGAVWRSDPEDGCGEGGVEARAMAGRSFGDRGQGFFNVEAAARALEGGCGTTRFNVAAGYRPRSDWLAMAEIYSDEPRGGEMGVRAQISMVRFSGGGQGLQIGLRARLDGDDLEPALVVALWSRNLG